MGTATLFSLVHLADRGGGLFAAIKSSLRLTHTAWQDSAIYFFAGVVVYSGSYKLQELLQAPRSVNEPSIFGDNADFLLLTAILIPFTTLSAIYRGQLYRFARDRQFAATPRSREAQAKPDLG